MTLAARAPSLQLLKEVGIFVTRDKNEVTIIRLWINLSTRTTYAVRCMSQHDPKPHVHNLRTGPCDDVFTGIPFVTRKDRAIEKVRDHRFSGSWSNLTQIFLCFFRVVPMKVVKYFSGQWRNVWPEAFSTAKCHAGRKWLLLLLLCCFDHLLCAYKPS